MIKLENVNKVYRTDRIETLALENINLDVQHGEFVSIMGPSGCGKSTLLNLIGLLDAPSAGRLMLDEQHINGAGDKKLARMRNEKLGFVFQSFHLVPDLKVLDNVEIPLLYRSMSGGQRRKLALEALDRVDELRHHVEHDLARRLLLVGATDDLADEVVHELRRTRVGIAGRAPDPMLRVGDQERLQRHRQGRGGIVGVPRVGPVGAELTRGLAGE